MANENFHQKFDNNLEKKDGAKASRGERSHDKNGDDIAADNSKSSGKGGESRPEAPPSDDTNRILSLISLNKANHAAGETKLPNEVLEEKTDSDVFKVASLSSEPSVTLTTLKPSPPSNEASCSSKPNTSSTPVSNQDLTEILGMVNIDSFNSESQGEGTKAEKPGIARMNDKNAEIEDGGIKANSDSNAQTDKTSVPDRNVNIERKPPPDLPPSNPVLANRFQCPPTPVDANYYGPQQQASYPSSPAKSALYGDLALEYLPVSSQVTTPTEASTSFATELQKKYAVKSNDSLLFTDAPKIKSVNASQDAAEARSESKHVDAKQQEQEKQQKQPYNEESDDDLSLFGSSGDDGEESMPDTKDSTTNTASGINMQQSQPTAVDESDDDKSLFGTSDEEDNDDKAQPELRPTEGVTESGDCVPELGASPTSEHHSKSDPQSKMKKDTTSQNNHHPVGQGAGNGHPNANNQIPIFDPPSKTDGMDESDEYESSDDGSVFSLNSDDETNNEGKRGMLGGILRKISRPPKNRDEKSFGKAGYTIQKKRPKKLKSHKLLSTKHPKPPPPQQKTKSPLLHNESALAAQLGEELAITQKETAKMVEVARQSKSKELERQHQLQKQQLKSSLVSSRGQGSPTDAKKKVTFGENNTKFIAKTARAMGQTSIPSQSRSETIIKKKGTGTGTSASKYHASFTATATSSKKKEQATSIEDWQSCREEKRWKEKFINLARFMKRFGHCDIPDGHSLEGWIKQQMNICQRWLGRRVVSNDELSKTALRRHIHIYCLEQIGFDWGSAGNNHRVQEALAVEFTTLSPAQLETFEIVGNELLPKREKKIVVSKSSNRRDVHGGQKRKNARNNVQRNKTSVFDSISAKRHRSSSKFYSKAHKDTYSSDEEEEFEMSDSQSDFVAKSSKATPRTVSDSSGDDNHGNAQLGIEKIHSKKRPRAALENGGFMDDRPDSLSWNQPRPKKKHETNGQVKPQILASMPAEQWIDLLMKCKKQYRSPSFGASSKGQDKCWYDLERAEHCGNTIKNSLDMEAPICDDTAEKQEHPAGSPAATTNPDDEHIEKVDASMPPNKPIVEKKMKHPLATNNSSQTNLPARTSLKVRPTKEASDGIALQLGERVYAAWWNDKNNSKAPYYYPGVVKSFKRSGSTLIYSIRFDDGDQHPGIEESFVIPRKKYLQESLKPILRVGDEVYAAWWEDEASKEGASWHPGVIKGRQEAQYGGRYGPICFYNVLFDDGDQLDSIEDYFVMNKFDYLLSVRKSIEGDYDGSDDGSENEKWIGVKNKIDKHSVDPYAKKAGWYVASILGKEQQFPNLSGALRAYDAHTVRRKGDNTEESDLNLPEEWAFPSPHGICPPVYIGGGCSSKKAEADSAINACPLPASTADTMSEKRSFNNKIKGEANAMPSKQAATTAKSSDRNSPGFKTSDNQRNQEQSATPEDKTPDVMKNFEANSSKMPCQKPESQQRTNVRVSDKFANFPAMPAEGFPPNWTVRRIPRPKGSCVDTFYFSPILGFKFSSKPEVVRFLECLQRTKGNEELAYKEYQGPTKSSTTMHYITPSNATTSSLASRGTDEISKILVTNKSNQNETSTDSPVLATDKPVWKVSAKISSSASHERSSKIDAQRYPSQPHTKSNNNFSYVDSAIDSKAETLGGTRSATKTILNLIDLTKTLESGSKSSSPKIASADLGCVQRSSSAKTIPQKSALKSDSETSSSKKASGDTACAQVASTAIGVHRKPTSKTGGFTTLSAKESRFPAMPAEDLPPNWTFRQIPRSKGKILSDKYWYSPVKSYRFRSKREIMRFLDCLKRTNGDEGLAMEELRRPQISSSKKKMSNKKNTSSMSGAAKRWKVLEYVEPSKAKTTHEENYSQKKIEKEVKESKTDAKPGFPLKPDIKKGEKVYACWSGGDGVGWFPGRVWDIKESPGVGYGPIKTYDIVFDDGDTESNVGEIWVAKKTDYEVCVQKPEESWVGVRNARFPNAKDEYAREIGWYEITVGGDPQLYVSLGDALRAHDKYMIESKGKTNISATDLNFPKEHNLI